MPITMSAETASSETLGQGPVITLPDERVDQLTGKLEEYRRRLDPTTHPDFQLLMGSDAAYKFVVLERLLGDGTVNTYDLSLEIAEQVGDKFDEDLFSTACGVVKDYCETGGENTIRGTLPPQPSES